MRLSPILLSVALLCASGLGMAAESRQLSPDGDGNCPETAAASNEATDEADPDAAAAPARRTQKAKPAPGRTLWRGQCFRPAQQRAALAQLPAGNVPLMSRAV